MKKQIDNIAFYLRVLWDKNRGYFIGFSALVLSMSFSPLITIILPKVMISGIIEKDFYQLVIRFAFLAVLSCLFSFVISYYSVKNSDIFVGIGFRLKESIQEKAMTMRFELTENPAMLTKIKGAAASVDCFVASINVEVVVSICRKDT